MLSKILTTFLSALLAAIVATPARADFIGDFAPATTAICGQYTTYSLSTGAPATLGGSPALAVYKIGDGTNSTTESTTGVTHAEDVDSRTGLNRVCIDTSADGTFYSAGGQFSVVITTGTLGGTSIAGSEVKSFSLNKVAALRPATAGRTLVVDSAGLADANTVKVGPTGSGTAQTAADVGANSAALVAANIILGAKQTADSGTTTTLVDAALTQATNDWFKGAGILFTSGTLAGQEACATAFTASSHTITFSPAVTTAVTTNDYYLFPMAACQTGDSYARLGAPFSASISADVAGVQADTDNLQTRVPTSLVGGRINADMGAISTDATAADNAESFFDGTGYAGTNNVIPTVTTLTNAPSDSSGVTTLLARLTSARATNLDLLLSLGRRTTIATLTTQTNFTLTDGSSNDNAYNGFAAFIYDSSSAEQISLGVVSDYTGSTKTIQLVTDPGIFTVAAGDTILLIPALLTNSVLDETVEGETFRNILCRTRAILYGQATSAGVFKDPSGATTRVTVAYGAADGDRSTITLGSSCGQ